MNMTARRNVDKFLRAHGEDTSILSFLGAKVDRLEKLAKLMLPLESDPRQIAVDVAEAAKIMQES